MAGAATTMHCHLCAEAASRPRQVVQSSQNSELDRPGEKKQKQQTVLKWKKISFDPKARGRQGTPGIARERRGTPRAPGSAKECHGEPRSARNPQLFAQIVAANTKMEIKFFFDPN